MQPRMVMGTLTHMHIVNTENKQTLCNMYKHTAHRDIRIHTHVQYHVWCWQVVIRSTAMQRGIA